MLIGSVCRLQLDSSSNCPVNAGLRTDGEQSMHQLAALLITVALGITGGLITGFIMKKMTVLDRYAEDYAKWGEIEVESDAEEGQ